MNLISPAVRWRPFAPWVIILVSAAIALAAYLQALDYPFISDDGDHIVTNTRLSDLRLTELWRLFIEPYNGFFEFLPLRDLSFWLDINLFGLNPAAFRMHNIFLYLLCLPLIYGTTLGVWRYFRAADATSAPWAAATVTALFALHPALVESVVWITGRKYMLPNLLAMLALWFAVHAKREQGFSTSHAAAALVALAAMMLAKASYVAVAPLIAMLWVFFWHDISASNRHRFLLLWPLAALLLGVALIIPFISIANDIYVLLGEVKAPYYFGIEVITRTLAVLGWLTRLVVTPEDRHFFYPVFEDTHLHIMVALGLVVLVAVATGAVMLLRKRSLETFALVTFFLLCIPYLHLMPYGSPALVQDRYLSLAAWPAILLIVACAWRLKPAPRAVLLVAIALSWSFQIPDRVRDWRSLDALVETDLRAYPGYYMPAVYQITGVQFAQGLYRDAIKTANGIADPEHRDSMIKLIKAVYAVRVVSASTGNPQEAMTLLWQLGLDLKQMPAQARWNSPVSLLWVKRRDILRDNWKDLAERFPDNESVRYNAGLWLLGNHQTADAVLHLRAATESQRLPPAVRGTAFKNLGLALLSSGQTAAAEIPLRAALEQSPPDMRAHCLLAEIYKQNGRHEEAARAKSDCSQFTPAQVAQ